MSISVIIPLFNKAQHICRALSSVLSQTIQRFECIVVDDGSTDGGGDIVAGIKDPRIRLVRQPNAGVSRARNKGVELARHPLVAFLDADDEWLPEFLQQTTAFAQEHPTVAAVYANILSTSEASPWLFALPPIAMVVEDYFQLCIRNGGRGMTSSSVLLRKQALESAGGFPVDVHASEDADTWVRLALTAEVACIPEVLAVYHNNYADPAKHYRLRRKPVFPQCVKTLRRWRQDKKIRLSWLESSLRFENLYLLQVHKGID